MKYWRHLSPDREAYAEHMRGFAPWSVFCTFTFKDHVPDRYAHDCFKLFCWKLARDLIKEHITIFFAWEPQLREVLHFHALMAILADDYRAIKPQLVRNYWTGNAKVEKYDAKKKGERYIARHKYYDTNVACPRPPACRRRDGCIKAPGPWAAFDEQE